LAELDDRQRAGHARRRHAADDDLVRHGRDELPPGDGAVAIAHRSHADSRDASVRKTVKPMRSCSAVSKGPAVAAGSNPNRFDTSGMTVPMNAAVTTAQTIAAPTTRPNTVWPDQ